MAPEWPPSAMFNALPATAISEDGPPAEAEGSTIDESEASKRGTVDDFPDVDFKKTPWYRRFNELFTGKIIPFGAGVYFKPAPTKSEPSKAAPRLSYGVFLGYRILPGCKWNGQYLVGDLDDFVGRTLAENEDRSKWHRFTPHITAMVALPHSGIAFPLKARYNKSNFTLEGRETDEKMAPVDPPLSLDVPPVTPVEPKASSSGSGGTAPSGARVLTGYKTGADGKRYPIDQYGVRFRTPVPSARPAHIAPDIWSAMSEAEKNEERRKIEEVASPAVDNDEFDLERVNHHIETFNQSIEDFNDGTANPAAVAFNDDDAAVLAEVAGEVIPSMPTADFDDVHREKRPITTFGLPCAVARPVGKAEREREPEAQKAIRAEWLRLRNKKVWDEDSVREWSDVASEARRRKLEDPTHNVHMGRLFGICVEKGSELPVGDSRRKYKYRVVFQGNRVITQNWEAALFQDMGSSPASMEAGKYAVSYTHLTLPTNREV